MFIIWLWWVSQGRLVPDKAVNKVELLDNLEGMIVDVSSDAQKVKNIIKQDINNLEQAEDRKKDLILKLKTTIEENYSTSVSTSVVTSTIDQVKNEEKTE